MKMPVTIGQKKAKLIEQLLEEMSVGMHICPVDVTFHLFVSSLSLYLVDLHPMPTENICVQFNDLRFIVDLVYACKCY